MWLRCKVSREDFLTKRDGLLLSGRLRNYCGVRRRENRLDCFGVRRAGYGYQNASLKLRSKYI